VPLLWDDVEIGEMKNDAGVNENEIDEISKRFLVKKNILFVDPLSKTIKAQSRLNLLAVRDVMMNVGDET
jgi:hypothetical protein